MMNKFLFFFVLSFTVLASQELYAQSLTTESNNKRKVIYFRPSIDPDLKEIEAPTYSLFEEAINNKISQSRKFQFLSTEAVLDTETENINDIIEYCTNNDAEFALISKITYFKVGLGKYVFSNQVVASMKLYDKTGTLVHATQYNTYKKNKRLLGSTTNSVKIGVTGAADTILKELRKLKI